MTRTRIARTVGICALAAIAIGFPILNLAAYNQAYAMMHFSGAGTRTPRPEALSFGQKVKVLFTGIRVPRPKAGRRPSDLGLPFEEHTIRCANGIRLSAWYIPATEPETLVVLFHGYGAEKSGLLTEANLLHQSGWPVLLVDFRGAGDSSGSVTTAGFLEADDVAEVLAYARTRLPHHRAILFGQSMGAVAILRAIDCRGVRPDGIILEAVFDTMLNTVKNRFHAMRVPSFPSAELLVFWGGRQVGFDGFSHRPVDYARSVKCPVLFMEGADDPKATPAEARRVFDAIPGPKEWMEFASVGHESYAARYPAEWQAAVREFITRKGDGK